MKLTHRQVEVFRAVMNTGSVTQAAQALHTSQPTVSRELARLEQVLQIDLFDRVRGRLRPTARALALLEEVQRSYLGLERIAAAARSLREFTQGRLAVACLPALAHGLLPMAVHRFAAAHPQVGITITPQESPLLEEWLTEQRFDLGLCERIQAPAATGISTLLQADEVAVLPDGHPLLARRVLRPKDFAGQAFVSFAPADPYREQVDALFEREGVQRRLVIETASAASVCALVRQGLGLAIVNPLTALELAGTSSGPVGGRGLQVRPLSFSIPFVVTLVQPQLRPASPLRDAFVKDLHQAAGLLQTRLRQLARPPR
ncbi:MAG: LysR family transcriptional regulator [Rhizobacter sp.]|nr:LysR family transcriptional regulator [Rhizobacter sp.]